MSTASKRFELSELTSLVARHRDAGERIVFTSGCFDLIHVGHVRSLRAARALGDRLVVGLNTDESVRALKGSDRPYFAQEERVEVLSALDMIDWIVLVPEVTMDRTLEALRPQVFAKGTDYTPETIPERETVLAFGGELAIVGDPKTRSSRDFGPVSS